MSSTAWSADEILPEDLVAHLVRSCPQLDRLAPQSGLIDVRSELEFEQGHLPSFANMPILTNPEREQVGTMYKQSGQPAAIELGHQLVSPHRQARIDAWLNITKTSSEPPILMCWRGGLRSQTAARWLRENGQSCTTVKGGYKAVRKFLLQVFEAPHTPVVLTGLTGSGKTQLLQRLGDFAIDLEGLARHRGSAFGRFWNQTQPSQATFENLLALSLKGRATDCFVVEDESLRIGDVALPNSFKSSMQSSPLVILEVPLNERIRNIYDDYIGKPLKEGASREFLKNCYIENLRRIEKKLGGLLCKELLEKLQSAFLSVNDEIESHSRWIKSLLIHYYDPLYEYSFSKQTRKVLFQGGAEACLTFLQNQCNSPRR